MKYTRYVEIKLSMITVGYAGIITTSDLRHLSFEKLNMLENKNIQCTLNWIQ